MVFTTFILLSLLGILSRVAAEWLGAPFPALFPFDGSQGSVQDPFVMVHGIMTLLTNLVSAFFIAPLAVSVHRFVLMGEARDKLAFDLSLLDVRFGIWVVVASCIPELLGDGQILLNLRGAASVIYGVAFPISYILVAPRLSLIFPLVAAGGTDPLKTSWTLTKHHVARIASVSFIITMFGALLFVLLYFPCRAGLHHLAQRGWIKPDIATTPALFICVSACSTLLIGALAAMASHFLLEYRKPNAAP